jgi:hypothetical protein
MAEPLPVGRVLLMTSTWDGGETERSFVLRSLAGAISRRRTVDVVTPEPPRAPRPDGLFDVHQIGTASPGQCSWPLAGAAHWPALPPPTLVLVPANDAGAVTLAREFAPSAPVLALVGSADPVPEVDALITVTPDRRDAVADAHPALAAHVYDTGLHVPVNPFVTKRPHSGVGFVDYLLVLTDRAGPAACDGSDPTPWVAWLAARFPRQHIMVVEDAVATVWQWRSRRGAIDVETRTDLWRLFAHARTVIDLRPGTFVARECVEALRVSTPIIAPAGSIGAEHGEAGGGIGFTNVDELLRAVASLEDKAVRNELGHQGRIMADERYGHPDQLVDRMADIIAVVEQAGPRTR